MPTFNSQEVDRLMEIRSRLKAETGQKLMLSSNDIYHELEAFWHITPNAITKSKIRSFLSDKGVKWDDPLAT